MSEGFIKLFLFVLFLPLIVFWYLCKGIYFLCSREVDLRRRTKEELALAESAAVLGTPVPPVSLPVTPQNTLYGSQQPDR